MKIDEISSVIFGTKLNFQHQTCCRHLYCDKPSYFRSPRSRLRTVYNIPYPTMMDAIGSIRKAPDDHKVDNLSQNGSKTSCMPLQQNVEPPSKRSRIDTSVNDHNGNGSLPSMDGTNLFTANGTPSPQTNEKKISSSKTEQSMVCLPDCFEEAKHFYPRVLNAHLHPMVQAFLKLGNERIAMRYCHLYPTVDQKALLAILKSQCSQFLWSGADLINVTNHTGNRQMVVIELNSCPSGQKSMPTPAEEEGSDGYHKLMRHSFFPKVEQLQRARALPAGGLAVIYDKNDMEAHGYAYAMANVSREPVYLAKYKEDEPNPPVKWVDGVMYVRLKRSEYLKVQSELRNVGATLSSISISNSGSNSISSSSSSNASNEGANGSIITTGFVNGPVTDVAGMPNTHHTTNTLPSIPFNGTHISTVSSPLPATSSSSSASSSPSTSTSASASPSPPTNHPSISSRSTSQTTPLPSGSLPSSSNLSFGANCQSNHPITASPYASNRPSDGYNSPLQLEASLLQGRDLTGASYTSETSSGGSSPCSLYAVSNDTDDPRSIWVPIRASFRYVTQRPWSRIPVSCRTLVYNPVVACLAGGRNKLAADKAYEFFNKETAPTGLGVRTPATIRDVRREEVPLWVRSMGGKAVVKVPYSNAGQGVYTILNEEELNRFMSQPHHYDKYIVQSLIGHAAWSSSLVASAPGQGGVYFHTGTVPNNKGNIYVADLRMMVCSTPNGFMPLAVYARRALMPLRADISSLTTSSSTTSLNPTLPSFPLPSSSTSTSSTSVSSSASPSASSASPVLVSSTHGDGGQGDVEEKKRDETDSWAMLGTNLSIKRDDGGWDTDTTRLLLMDSKDFNKLGIGIDDLIDAYVQTVLGATAIDRLASRLTTERGCFNIELFAGLNSDNALLHELKF